MTREEKIAMLKRQMEVITNTVVALAVQHIKAEQRLLQVRHLREKELKELESQQ